MRPALLLVLGAAALAGCDPPQPPGPPEPKELQLGTIDVRRHGDSRWVDNVDGQDAELAPGAQGDCHSWLRYRGRPLGGKGRGERIADRRPESGPRQRVLTAPES